MAKATTPASLRGGAGAHFWRDPFRSLWRLFTSVRFAFALTGFLAFAGLLGVLIPQIPLAMRDNAPAIDAWLLEQGGKFGALTEPMYRVGLFNVFGSWWFRILLGVLVVSVTVCTANRMPPTFRNVFRPRERVPDSYFERARSRAGAANVAGVDALVQTFRRRRYRVKRFDEQDGVTYLFADRFAWAQLATFVSHLGLIVVLAGAVVSLFLTKESRVFLGEGTTAAIGNLEDGLLQVKVLDAVERFDDEGHIIEYRTDMAVYKQGEEVCRGASTVNSPLSCEGYRFHQSTFFPDGAALSVADEASGRTLYSETLPLLDPWPYPRVVVRDATNGEVLFDESVPLTASLEGAFLSIIRVPERDLTLWVGARPEEEDSWSLVVFQVDSDIAESRVGTVPPGGDEPIRLIVPEGGTARAADLDFAFPAISGAASSIVQDLPDQRDVLLQMIPDDGDGRRLVVSGLGDSAFELGEGEWTVVDGKRYTFEGQREFAGLTVRRDPGTPIIWIAGGMILLGLVGTFYLPRRRLWAKVTTDRVMLAGVAERTVDFKNELRKLLRDAGNKLDAKSENGDDDDDED
ncbi:MAG TPA: cytochrome c biogenesis protein ResB [Dehalococcoidia bacterium]|nr:cytochrome c biogenesis protein ResB [Dehalococcoidia bacterium]